MNHQPPFYANPTNDHCWQACVRMVLAHFEPEHSWGWAELDTFTAKPENMGTYPSTTLYKMADRGYSVAMYGAGFNWKEQSEDIIQYFEKKFSKESMDYIIKNTIVEKEERAAAEIQLRINQEKMDCIYEDATAKTIRNIFKENALAIVWVNSRILYKKEGFVGHFVVAYHVEGNNILFHDPGFQTAHEKFSQSAQNMSIDDFLNAATNNQKNNTSIYTFNKEN